jgi:hypothetical protein
VPNEVHEVMAEERMNQSYTTRFTVNQTPAEVFAAVTNVRGWWSEDIEGSTDILGAEFFFRSSDLHRSTQKITELIPGTKVVWHVVDSQIAFVTDTTEWTGTEIVFEITRQGDRTELSFTHIGLIRAIECYGSCADAWGFYINHSLLVLITTGTGKPSRKENQIAESS